MKYLFTLIVTLLVVSVNAQKELLNQCFVLELESETTVDLREASFDLPFYAKRATKDSKPTAIPHYAFDPNGFKPDKDLQVGLKVIGLRPYEFGETLGPNQIAFMVMEWPEDQLGDFEGPHLASFPSVNGTAVSSDHLIVETALPLPKIFVEQLKLPYTELSAGQYRIKKMNITY